MSLTSGPGEVRGFVISEYDRWTRYIQNSVKL